MKTVLARTADVPPGKTLAAKVGDEHLLLCNVEGSIHAIEDVCTHDGAQLGQGVLDGCRITCPRHGAVFDVTNGNVLVPPAVVPLRTFRVTVIDDMIAVDL